MLVKESIVLRHALFLAPPTHPPPAHIGPIRSSTMCYHAVGTASKMMTAVAATIRPLSLVPLLRLSLFYICPLCVATASIVPNVFLFVLLGIRLCFRPNNRPATVCISTGRFVSVPVLFDEDLKALHATSLGQHHAKKKYKLGYLLLVF